MMRWWWWVGSGYEGFFCSFCMHGLFWFSFVVGVADEGGAGEVSLAGWGDWDALAS